MENGDLVAVYKQFIDTFASSIDNFSQDDCETPFRLSTFYVGLTEVEGECLDWIRRYLSLHDCPIGLVSQLARAVYTNLQESVHLANFYLEAGEKDRDSDDSDDDIIDGNRRQGSSVDRLHNCRPPQIDASRLLQEVVSYTHATVRSWSTKLPVLKAPPTSIKVCSYAIKNTRRKMEDRHVIIPDLNVLFELKDSPNQSYFAIFDGHCGSEAAEYASTHLHWHLVKDQLFNNDPEAAFKRAYKTTDIKFVEKAKRESLRSGTTGVSALLRESEIYVGWLGDSQAILVRSGQPVQIMKPHKPEREDEKRRIEDLGGCVLFNGVWRVNGHISVSRAIGDVTCKPFICSDADTIRVALTGEEEYLILACDGLWDVITPLEAVKIVYKHSMSSSGEDNDAATALVRAARDLGSSDNISVIVVLFRLSLSTPQLPSDGGFVFGNSLASDTNFDKLVSSVTCPHTQPSSLNSHSY